MFKTLKSLNNRGTTTTRASKVKVSQIGADGKELPSCIGEQKFRLDMVSGFTAKLRCSYHKNMSFDGKSISQWVANEKTDKTSERDLPPKLIRIADLDTPVDELDTTLIRQQKGDRVPDPNFVLKVDGKVHAKNVFDETVGDTGRWVKREYNVPVYLRRIDGAGAPLEKINERLEDDKGVYIETLDEYSYYRNYNLLVFNGYEINENGNKVRDTEGVYMSIAPFDADETVKGIAQKNSMKLSVKQYLRTVFMHPTMGNVSSKDLKKGKLSNGILDGYFPINGREVTAVALNGDGKIAGVLSDRPSWNIGEYIPKRTRQAVEAAEKVDHIVENVIDEDVKVDDAAKAEDTEESFI